MIDISSINPRAYSAQELRNYWQQGLLQCRGFYLSEFLDCLMEGMQDSVDLDNCRDNYSSGYEDGYSDGMSDSGENEDLKDRIDRAIRILEGE